MTQKVAIPSFANFAVTADRTFDQRELRVEADQKQAHRIPDH